MGPVGTLSYLRFLRIDPVCTQESPTSFLKSFPFKPRLTLLDRPA
jgi:hypothetical protein